MPERRIKLGLWLNLTKFWLSLLVAMSFTTGYVLAAGTLEIKALALTLCLLLMASGSGALNNVQDRLIDSRLERTKNRPLVTGALSPTSALLLSVGLIGTGLLGLYALSSLPQVLGIGIAAIFLYNIVYTYGKRHSVWAILPGALCGTLPPLMGWMAAGSEGSLLQLALFGACLFIWQMPHFWMLVLEERSDYLRSMLPNLIVLLGQEHLGKLSAVWIAALATLFALVPVTGLVESTPASAIVALFALVLAILAALTFVSGKLTRLYKPIFLVLNIAMAGLMLCILVERF